MTIAADNEITPTFQPKAVCNGSISTPGVARRPAEQSSARKITATTTKAYFWPNGRLDRGWVERRQWTCYLPVRVTSFIYVPVSNIVKRDSESRHEKNSCSI